MNLLIPSSRLRGFQRQPPVNLKTGQQLAGPSIWDQVMGHLKEPGPHFSPIGYAGGGPINRLRQLRQGDGSNWFSSRLHTLFESSYTHHSCGNDSILFNFEEMNYYHNFE